MLLILVAIIVLEVGIVNTRNTIVADTNTHTTHIIIMYISLRIQGNKDSDQEVIEME